MKSGYIYKEHSNDILFLFLSANKKITHTSPKVLTVSQGQAHIIAKKLIKPYAFDTFLTFLCKKEAKK